MRGFHADVCKWMKSGPMLERSSVAVIGVESRNLGTAPAPSECGEALTTWPVPGHAPLSLRCLRIMPSHAMIVGEAVSEHPGFRKQFLEQATTSFLIPAAEQPVAEQLIPI